MDIEILGTESLGVRGLCCWLNTGERRVLFDPGVALGYRREGLLPHPVQVAEGERVRRNILHKCEHVTDVVISHFHGEKRNGLGTVMMTRVESEGDVFVHASDIQLLDPAPVERIIEWEPSVVIVSGPPLYRELSDRQKKAAWKNAVTLASHGDICLPFYKANDERYLQFQMPILWSEH